ncbi:hypothetical protein LGQ02_01405 [Bacillus shivajii]|uniref:hypothetical protein n=1 Tax=Bacillus shivajii TaxID=1983719 RepID=UPI001CFB2620|nr:hypothetical protein [Bacillus shivajii]UCZ53486.1 hypothetical protein LGQ02_01405 [Bacillus shivajii]
MNKNTISLAVVALFVVIALFIFREPDDNLDTASNETTEQLQKENERLKQEINELEYKAELYESRSYEFESRNETLIQQRKQLEDRLEIILKDIYESDLEGSDLENLHEYRKHYETMYMERYDALDGHVFLFRMSLPRPEVTVGEELNYVFSFEEEFEVYEGKEVAIAAIHKDTEEMVTVLDPQRRSEEEMRRLTGSATLPVGGFWNFEVSLDEEFYGEVEIFVYE